MAYDIYASPVPVPPAERDTMVAIRFYSMPEALHSAYTLLRAGWHVYRVSGPDGFELTEKAFDEYSNESPRAEARQLAR